ncbi:MAG: hypothetical protein V3S27_03480, partial [Kiloniellales bacterium]
MPKALAKALEVVRAPSAGIPLDIMTPLQDKAVSGRLKVIVEGMPLGGTLSAGTNNWDNTWSLTVDELNDLYFFPAQNDDRDHTLSIRVLRFDSDGYDVATTAAMIEVLVEQSARGADGGAKGVGLAEAEAIWRAEHEQAMAQARATWEAEEAERLAAAKRAWEQQAADRLAAAQTAWERDTEDRLAEAAGARATEERDHAALELTATKASWAAAAEERLAAAKRAWEQQAADRLAAAQAAWERDTEDRLAETAEARATEERDNAALELTAAKASWAAEAE